MHLLSLILLMICALSKKPPNSDPCDCFSLKLVGSPQNKEDNVCYKYSLIISELHTDDCSSNIDYYVLSGGSECDMVADDLSDLITETTNDNYVITPYYGDSDDTNVNGIRINEKCSQSDGKFFEICFDANVVSGTQSNGLVGFKDNNGNGYNCIINDILPNFCNVPQNTKAILKNEVTISPNISNSDAGALSTTAEAQSTTTAEAQSTTAAEAQRTTTAEAQTTNTSVPPTLSPTEIPTPAPSDPSKIYIHGDKYLEIPSDSAIVIQNISTKNCEYANITGYENIIDTQTQCPIFGCTNYDTEHEAVNACNAEENCAGTFKMKPYVEYNMDDIVDPWPNEFRDSNDKYEYDEFWVYGGGCEYESSNVYAAMPDSYSDEAMKSIVNECPGNDCVWYNTPEQPMTQCSMNDECSAVIKSQENGKWQQRTVVRNEPQADYLYYPTGFRKKMEPFNAHDKYEVDEYFGLSSYEECLEKCKQENTDPEKPCKGVMFGSDWNVCKKLWWESDNQIPGDFGVWQTDFHEIQQKQYYFTVYLLNYYTVKDVEVESKIKKCTQPTLPDAGKNACIQKCTESSKYDVERPCKGVLYAYNYCRKLWWSGEGIEQRPTDLVGDIQTTPGLFSANQGIEFWWKVYLIKHEIIPERWQIRTDIRFTETESYIKYTHSHYLTSITYERAAHAREQYIYGEWWVNPLAPGNGAEVSCVKKCQDDSKYNVERPCKGVLHVYDKCEKLWWPGVPMPTDIVIGGVVAHGSGVALYIFVFDIVKDIQYEGQLKICEDKPVEFTYIYVDIYECNDFKYGMQNLYDSFDFTINFIGDRAGTKFVSGADDTICSKVNIKNQERLRCFIESDTGTAIGLGLVAVNLFSTSDSVICINNIDVFYTMSMMEYLAISFDTTDINAYIANDNALWRYYAFSESINNGIIFSDGGCEYTFYDKTNGDLIQCMESIKLYPSKPRNQIALKLHTCPNKGSGVNTKELESLYIQIIGKQLTNTSNSGWVTTNPINLLHYPRTRVETGYVPSYDKFYSKIKSSFKMFKNEESKFYSDYSGILRAIKFIPDGIYDSTTHTRIYELPDIELSFVRSKDNWSKSKKGNIKSLVINILEDKYIYQSDLLSLKWNTEDTTSDNRYIVGSIYFHLAEGCEYESINVYAAMPELPSDEAMRSVASEFPDNNYRLYYDTPEEAMTQCSMNDECSAIIKSESNALGNENWQLRTAVRNEPQVDYLYYSEGFREKMEPFNPNDKYEVDEYFGLSSYEECLEKCKQENTDPQKPCKGVMFGSDWNVCKKLWWDSDLQKPNDFGVWQTGGHVIQQVQYYFTVYLLNYYTVKDVEVESKIKICTQHGKGYELPFKSVVSLTGKTGMYDLDKACMEKYHSHLASLHSIEQQEAARLQMTGDEATSWIGFELRNNVNKYQTELEDWEFTDFTVPNFNSWSFGDFRNDASSKFNNCAMLKEKDTEIVWNDAACDEPLSSTGICGTYGWFSNEYRTFIFNTEAEMNEISMVNVFIENENVGEDISICIDEVELLSSTEYNEAGSLGSIVQNTINNNEQSYIFLKYAVCNVEVIDTTLDWENKQDVDTEDYISGYECKNYNRFATSTCDISQEFTKEDSISSSVTHSTESSYSMEHSTSESFSWSWEVGVQLEVQLDIGAGKGGPNSKDSATTTTTTTTTKAPNSKRRRMAVTGGHVRVQVEAKGGQTRQYTESTATTKARSYSTANEDGFTKTISKTISCSGSVDVPRGHQQSYALSFLHTNSTIPTTSTLKLTLCADYVDSDVSYPPIYEKGVPGKIEIRETASCKIEFLPPSYLGNGDKTCFEEQQLGWFSPDSSYGWIPRCNQSDPILYDGCQCFYDGTDLDRTHCFCVDPKSGDPPRDDSQYRGKYEFNVAGKKPNQAAQWFLSCQQLNCPGSVAKPGAPNPYETQQKNVAMHTTVPRGYDYKWEIRIFLAFFGLFVCAIVCGLLGFVAFCILGKTNVKNGFYEKVKAIDDEIDDEYV